MRPVESRHGAFVFFVWIAVSVFLTLTVSAGWASAQTVPEHQANWIDASGDWSGKGNWSPHVVPNNNPLAGTFFNVTISPAAPQTITLDLSPAVDSLTLGSTATLANLAGHAETLTIGSPNAPASLVNNGVMNLSDFSALVFFAAPAIATPIALDNEGSINLGSSSSPAAMAFYGAGDVFDLFSLNGTGTVNLSDNRLNLITGVTGFETLINDTGETIQGAGTITNLALLNNGTIIANGTHPLVITPNFPGFLNNGTLAVAPASTMQVSGLLNLNPAGTILTGGGYDVAGKLVLENSNAITTVNGANVILDGAGPAAIEDGSGSNALAGLSKLNGGILGVINGAALNLSGPLTSNQSLLLVDAGGLLTVNGTLASKSIFSAVEVDDGSEMAVHGNVINDGSFTTANPVAPSTFSNGIAVTGNFNNQGALGLGNPGDELITGTFTNGGNGVVLLTPGTALVAAGIPGSTGSPWTNLNSAGVVSGGTYNIQGAFAYNSTQGITGIGSGTRFFLEGAGKVLDTSPVDSNALDTLASNQGTFGLLGGAAAATNGSLRNSGTLEIIGDVVTGAPSVLGVRGNLINTGAVSVTQGAGLLVAGKIENNGGQVYVDPFGSVIEVAGASGYSQSGGSTQIDGTLLSPVVTINGGKLSGTGAIAGVNGGTTAVSVAGTLLPGDEPGTLMIQGSLDLPGTLDEGIDFTSFGVTDISGELTLGHDSLLDIMMSPGFTAPPGTVLDIMNFGSLSGVFGSISGERFPSGEFWAVNYTPTEITLTAKTPEPDILFLLGTGLLLMAVILRRGASQRKRG